MMHPTDKASLIRYLNQWNEAEAPDLGIWFDDSTADATMCLLASAVELVVDAMKHQIEMEKRFTDND